MFAQSHGAGEALKQKQIENVDFTLSLVNEI
jgi:hypothetical protein